MAAKVGKGKVDASGGVTKSANAGGSRSKPEVHLPD
jgi:hypothetical protein